MKYEGYRCSVTSNGEEALTLLEKEPADVAITDINMPIMDGIQLTKIIKEKYDTDVIIMTGFVNDFSYEDIIDIGVSDFVNKPVGLKEMIIRTKRVLRERRILKERDHINFLNQTLTLRLTPDLKYNYPLCETFK